MSSLPLLQCFFCQHLNPADALFCNECGKPLTLRPCAHCGALNDRAARKCHECGSEFPPERVGQALADSALNDAGAVGQGVLPAAPDSTHLLPEPPAVNEPVSSEGDATALLWRKRLGGGAGETVSAATAATATRPGRWGLLAAAALLLALVINLAYVRFYAGPPEQRSQQQGNQQPAALASGAPAPERATPLAVAPPAGPVLSAADTAQKTATGAAGLDKSPSPSREPPAEGLALAGRPSPATEGEATGGALAPAALVVKQCPPAVATLGLCSPAKTQEQ